MKKILSICVLLISFIVPAGEVETDNTREKDKQSQCWSITKSGNRCKRRARPDDRYCRQHSSSLASSRPIERCRSMTDSGSQCKDKPLKGKSYCAKHSCVKH